MGISLCRRALLLVHARLVLQADHSAVFSGDLDRVRSIDGCAFWVGGEAGFEGGELGASFSRAASAL
jgi:hypothetical protein